MSTLSPSLFSPQPASPARRQLLKRSGLLAASGFVGTLGALQSRQVQAAGSGKQLLPGVSPYGPLAPVADLSTGLPLLQLPEGFSYQSHGWTADPMSDGQPTPSTHDAMAAVSTRITGRVRETLLVRNHERALVPTPAEQIQAPQVYSTGAVNGIITITGVLTVRIGASGIVTNPTAPDPAPFTGYAGGGTTNLIWRNNQWAGARGSLAGTLGNCAGGATPWGSWLSCEETVFDFSAIGGRKHGYVFEVAAGATPGAAEPIVGMGRFVHEAAAVDPATGAVYLTEDNRNVSALFRYLPDDTTPQPGALQRGGRLQAARIKTVLQQANPLSLAQSNDLALLNPDIGDRYALEWVDVADPDAGPRTVAGVPGGVPLAAIAGPTLQALSAGCARMSRGEGLWLAGGKLYIVDTGAGTNAGGAVGQGEGAVWELDLASQMLRSVFASGAAVAGNNPDNVVVSPRGGIVLCEDGGASVDSFGSGSRLLGLSPAGEAYIFAKNNIVLDAAGIASAGKLVAPGDYTGREFCGACFDPTGRVMFVNVQTPGITFAITGPWSRGNL